MLEKIIKNSAPFAADYISLIEREVGWVLPTEYKAFLLNFGSIFIGGYFDNDEKYSILATTESSGPYDVLRQIRLKSHLT